MKLPLVKIGGVMRKGPDGFHPDFIKTLMKERKWKKDPGGLADHPAKHRLLHDKADVKAAAGVNPLVRSSVNEGAPRGDDVQIPLTVNPYSTGTAGDPAQATQYENGYQFAQSLGHLGLNGATPEQVGSWATREPAWRDGFGAAASGLGCAQVADQMDSTPKTACWALEYFKTASPGAMNFLSGGPGFGIGSALAQHQMPDASYNDVSEPELLHARMRGSALSTLGAGALGALGAGIGGHLGADADGMHWGDMAAGATLGSSIGSVVPSAIYGYAKGRKMLNSAAKPAAGGTDAV